MIQEVFIESTWEDATTARQRRDERSEELEATGLECLRENLYTVDGRCVFLVTATPVEPELPPVKSQGKPAGPRLRSAKAGRRVPEFEER
ncbi:hypothetical protein [Leptolyngbya sp. FACHB-16]|uniref:hypothetical protein n=1 Tax=unclassified Leptolyngbya TaxID=2650499 RepID=UPI001683ABF9|nr:hypothetical protein [Leptolyngbya sp. FACHB-16]MBD2158877.1 hypothetical protein [Leptolyngbya sp. FACHB-16]